MKGEREREKKIALLLYALFLDPIFCFSFYNNIIALSFHFSLHHHPSTTISPHHTPLSTSHTPNHHYSLLVKQLVVTRRLVEWGNGDVIREIVEEKLRGAEEEEEKYRRE